MKVMTNTAIPRLVAIETTNRCNAKCSFCPNNALARDRITMSDDLFEKIVDDCREFPLKEIEPFLNGEPFVDGKIFEKMELIRKRLPDTKLRLYSNGYAMTPAKINNLVGLGIDHLFISVNTLDKKKYEKIVGLDISRLMENLAYLTEPVRKKKVAKQITYRMTRLSDTSVAEQRDFQLFTQKHGVRPFISSLYNYKGDIPSEMPVPKFPCANITRLDILANGTVALCCMDQEGQYAWGDVRKNSVLEVYNGNIAQQYRKAHTTGNRKNIEPCDKCNVCSPSFSDLTPTKNAKFAMNYLYYYLKYRPRGIARP